MFFTFLLICWLILLAFLAMVSCKDIVPPSSIQVNTYKKKSLVLDLDETLVHSSLKPPFVYHHRITVFVDGAYRDFFVICRPHLTLFMSMVSRWYLIYIFTAGVREYADPLIDTLDKHGVVRGRYFRGNCLLKGGFFIKDLTKIQMKLHEAVLVDNQPISYSLNEDNAVPIENFIDDLKDDALLNLIAFLDALRFTSDVRSILCLRTMFGRPSQVS